MATKVAVLGASGRIGLVFLRQLSAKGIEVVAVVRSASKLPLDAKDKVTAVVEGDCAAESTMQATLAHDPDVIVCAVGRANPRGAQTVRADVTRTFVDAIKDRPKIRLVAISSVGAGSSSSQVGFLVRAMLGTVLKGALADHSAQEDAITERLPSQQWLVVRPTGLNDKPVQGDYQVEEVGRLRSSNISRGAVVDFVIKQVEGAGESFWGKMVAITS